MHCGTVCNNKCLKTFQQSGSKVPTEGSVELYCEAMHPFYATVKKNVNLYPADAERALQNILLNAKRKCKTAFLQFPSHKETIKKFVNIYICLNLQKEILE